MSELILCPVQSNIAVGVILRDAYDCRKRRRRMMMTVKEKENLTDV